MARKKRWLEPIIRVLRRNGDSGLTVNQIAELIGVSSAHVRTIIAANERFFMQAAESGFKASVKYILRAGNCDRMVRHGEASVVGAGH